MSDQSRFHRGPYSQGNGRMAGMIFGIPRKKPEGLQRIATVALDWLTGDKWDFDRRGRSIEIEPTPPWGPAPQPPFGGPGRRPTPPIWEPGPGREFPEDPAPKPTPPIWGPKPTPPTDQPPILDKPEPPLGGPEQQPTPPSGTPPFYPTPDGKPIPTFPEQTPPILDQPERMPPTQEEILENQRRTGLQTMQLGPGWTAPGYRPY